jgi:hypothetical protein
LEKSCLEKVDEFERNELTIVIRGFIEVNLGGQDLFDSFLNQTKINFDFFTKE